MVIPIETSVCDLGVIFNAKLSWKDHGKSVRKKANLVMYRLNHFRRSTNLTLRRHLVQTLLFPLVDYCSFVFCDLSDELNLKLERIINTGIHNIYGIRKSFHITLFRRELV